MTLIKAPVDRPVRLVDIANAAGVHRTVVSRTLMGDPTLSIRPQVRKRILDLADKLGYKPNALARGLKTSTAGAVGVVVPSFRNPVWSGILSGILEEADDRGVAVLLAEVPDEVGVDTAYTRLVDEGRIDGLLLANSVPDGAAPTRVPNVHVNRASPGAACNVTMDEQAAVALAYGHLRDLGHRRLGLVDGPSSIDTAQRRCAALRQLCRGATRPTIVNAPYSEAGGYRAMAAMLDRDQRRRPTAIGVASFNMLIGALAAVRERGLRIPEDLSLVTFDDDPFLDYLDIRVTAVHMPLGEMGRTAMGALMDLLGGKTVTDIQIDHPITLVARQSTSPPLRRGKGATT